MGETQASMTQAGLEPGCELDLCFICDCTGSMSSYIKAAQENIITIVEKISTQHEAGVRFGLISYRDHPPQDRTYVTKCFPFTEKRSKMLEYVTTMSAQGGGDGPEAVTAGLYEALHLPWRPNATKVCVLIADAPPHGLELQGDGFPNGDPDGHDPLEIAREMVVQGITVYTVGCEPALGHYRFARDFLCTLAEITSGQAVALRSAALLADVIVNGSAEELCLAKLQREVEEEVQRVQLSAHDRGRDMTTSEAVHAACANLHAGGMRSLQVETDGRMENATSRFWGTSEKKSLAKVKADLGNAFPEAAEPDFAHDLSCSLRSESATSLHRRSMFQSLMSAMWPFGKDSSSTAKRTRSLDISESPPASAMAMPSGPPPRAAASSHAVKTDLISEEQVARIVSRAQYQKRL